MIFDIDKKNKIKIHCNSFNKVFLVWTLSSKKVQPCPKNSCRDYAHTHKRIFNL